MGTELVAVHVGATTGNRFTKQARDRSVYGEQLAAPALA